MNLSSGQFAFASILETDLIFELVGLVVACFWYGVFVVFITVAIFLHITRNGRTWAQSAHFCVNVLGFALATTYVACRVSAIFIVVDGTLVKDASLVGLSEQVVRKLTVNETVIAWAAFTPALIIDGTLIRGVWALCQSLYRDKRWLISLPCILWLGTFGTTLTYVVWLSTPSGFELYTQPAPTPINDLLISGLVLSNATNLVATSLFGWVFWSRYHAPKAALGNTVGPTDVKNIMALLVESGTLYLTTQLLYLGFMGKPLSGTTGRLFGCGIVATYAIFSAAYPTAIAVLKELRKSSAESMLKTSMLHKAAGLNAETTNTIENGDDANTFALQPLLARHHPLIPVIDIARID